MTARTQDRIQFASASAVRRAIPARGRQPDGTRTRDEHRAEIVRRTNDYVGQGLTPDEALTKASADWQQFLKQEGDEKVAAVKRFLAGGAVRDRLTKSKGWANLQEAVRTAVKPTIRTAFADLLVALADNHPVNIIGEADSADMEERAEHVQAVLGAVETYLTAVLADAKHRTSGLDFDVNVMGRLADMQGDLVGAFRNAADAMREFKREREADDL